MRMRDDTECGTHDEKQRGYYGLGVTSPSRFLQPGTGTVVIHHSRNDFQKKKNLYIRKVRIPWWRLGWVVDIGWTTILRRELKNRITPAGLVVADSAVAW